MTFSSTSNDVSLQKPFLDSTLTNDQKQSGDLIISTSQEESLQQRIVKVENSKNFRQNPSTTLTAIACQTFENRFRQENEIHYHTSELRSQITAAQQQVDSAIKDFQEISKKVNDKLLEHTLKLMSKAFENGVSDREATQMNFSLNLSTEMTKRYSDVANVLMEMQKTNIAGKLQVFSDFITLDFKIIMSELSILSKNLEILASQENPEVLVETQSHAEKLKAVTEKMHVVLKAPSQQG